MSGGSASRQASHRLSITQKSKPCGHKEGAPQLHAPLPRRHAVPNLMHSCTDSQLSPGTACNPTSISFRMQSATSCRSAELKSAHMHSKSWRKQTHR